MTDRDADLVVAGAGAAGLAASLSAAEKGCSVLLFEAKENFREDCNTALSTSMVPAGGSRWQEAIGIDDSPQNFHEDVMRKTEGKADPVVADALTAVAPELVDWMADQWGVPFELVTDFSYPGHSRDRCHAVPDRAGSTLHRHLLDALDGHESVTLAVPFRVIDLLTEGERVAGVRISNPDGTEEEVKAGSVVLATNGFGANRNLVQRHIPEIADALYFGGAGSTGDALQLGARVEADTACLEAYQGHGSVATPHGVLVTWATVMQGAILINAEGERFGDETIGYSEYARRVLGQPEGLAWVVFDERIDKACQSFADHQSLLEAGAVLWADDAEEIARLLDAPVGRVEKTLEQAAAAAVGDTEDPWGRKRWEAPLDPPYAVVKVTGALFHTQGGLKVDGWARVLRSGEPIGGLYAAGGAAVGISGLDASGYLAGNGLLSALGLGYLAGRHLAE